MKKKLSKAKKSAQEIQDEIFRQMSAGKKLRLASDLSRFLLKLHKLNDGGFRKTTDKISQDS